MMLGSSYMFPALELSLLSHIVSSAVLDNIRYSASAVDPCLNVSFRCLKTNFSVINDTCSACLKTVLLYMQLGIRDLPTADLFKC